MSVLVHGEEKRESVVRELHGVGLEHREARAVRHDDVVGAPCAGTLGVADRDRVRQGRVGVAVAVRRPHAAAARPCGDRTQRRRGRGRGMGLPVSKANANESLPPVLDNDKWSESSLKPRSPFRCAPSNSGPVELLLVSYTAS